MSADLLRCRARARVVGQALTGRGNFGVRPPSLNDLQSWCPSYSADLPQCVDVRVAGEDHKELAVPAGQGTMFSLALHSMMTRKRHVMSQVCKNLSI